MQSVLAGMPQLAAYQPALAALAFLILSIIAQSFLAGALALGPKKQMAGMPLRGDQSDFSFRVMRTYANSVENLPAFSAALFLAIVIGVSAAVVNVLALAHLCARLGYWAIYYSGIGKAGTGPRTIIYVIGLAINLILAGLAAWALIA